MTTRTLYELTAEYDAIFEAALAEADEDGGLPPDMVDLLNEFQDEILAKLEGCCRVLRSLESHADAIKAEVDRLRGRATRAANQATRLKDYMREQMEAIGLDKTDAGPFRLSICTNSQPTVTVIDLDAVPTTYDKPAARQVSLTAIRDDAAAGIDVPGVAIERGRHLRVK